MDESIGVVGASCLNTMNSNQGQAVRQVLDGPGGANYNANKSKLVSPNLPRKQQHKGPPNFTQLSAQKKQASELNKKQYNAAQRQMPYGQAGNIESEDEARSDFKTTTLRFTNNNFIVEDPRKKTNSGENTTGG